MFITESLALILGAAVSGFYFGHPESKYFDVGKIADVGFRKKKLNVGWRRICDGIVDFVGRVATRHFGHRKPDESLFFRRVGRFYCPRGHGRFHLRGSHFIPKIYL